MTWHDLPADPQSGALCTVTKKEVVIKLGVPLLRQLGWEEGTAVLARAGGGDNEGWLRLELSDFGTPIGAGLTIARTMLPAVPGCKDAPLLFKLEEDAVEIQLPIPVQGPAKGKGRQPGRPSHRAPAHIDNRPRAIHTSPPTEEWQQIRKDLAMKNVDLEFHDLEGTDDKIVTWNMTVIPGVFRDNEPEVKRRAAVVLSRSESPGEPASP